MQDTDQAIIYDPNLPESTPWFTDVNNLIAVALLIAVACGLVAALVARHNGRSVPLGFLTGLFFGPLGVMTCMIMGENSGVNRRK